MAKKQKTLEQKGITMKNFIAIAFLVFVAGCVQVKTNPSTGELAINSFLKDIGADKVSYSWMDAEGNGRTLDISKYQSDVTALAIQAYQFGLMAGRQEGAAK